jgi:hypothetical protein
VSGETLLPGQVHARAWRIYDLLIQYALLLPYRPQEWTEETADANS